MAIGWALLTALGFGLGDFCAGVAARRASALWVATVSALLTGSALLVLALLLAGPLPPGALLWGGATGVALAAGMLAYYVGFARGGMGMVAAVTGVWSAFVPLLIGLTLGERPTAIALVGVALLIAAIALVSGGQARRLPVHGIPDRPSPHDPSPHLPVSGDDARRAEPLPGGAKSDSCVGEPAQRSSAVGRGLRERWNGRMPGLIEATVAGIAFGLVFVFLGQAQNGHPIWPVAVAFLVAAAVLVMAVGWNRPSLRMPIATLGLVLIAGVLQAGATLAFVLAVREGLLSIVAVAGAMSPIPTAAAAWLILRERLTGTQKWGFGSAILGIVLIALS